ncbi:uncharacterized protein LOC108092314 [Drosophila ficusphila]|uniref:uncharacterized protein LOC108092314 n=1 Tax=Drosophila ficusphila TaxID=30025 RepID=UPI0007E7316B|nr:uncharacterized protein LOC108092314 [Drosophila ficusphila]
MDFIINKFKALKHLDDEESEIKSECLEDKKQCKTLSSNLDNLFDKLYISEGNSLIEDIGIEQSKPETTDCNNYPHRNYFNKSPTDFPWKKASEKGEVKGLDFDINYSNVFEDVSQLAEVEKQLQLLYRPFTCLMDVSCRFNMYELCLLISDSRYEPGSHPSVTVKVTHPSAQVKIYGGGKIVATALTANSARNAVFKVVRILQGLDYKADMKNYSKSIVNASFQMPFKLDLDLMIRCHSEEVTYNRNKRPFITFITEGAEARFAVFPTGFVLVLHSTSHTETRRAIAEFLPILARFNNGYPTKAEEEGVVVGDFTYKLLWEKRLEEDKDGLLLYS